MSDGYDSYQEQEYGLRAWFGSNFDAHREEILAQEEDRRYENKWLRDHAAQIHEERYRIQQRLKQLQKRKKEAKLTRPQKRERRRLLDRDYELLRPKAPPRPGR